MKYSIICLFLLLTAGCSKERFGIPIFESGSMATGKVAAFKNGIAWLASGAALRHDDGNDEFIGIYAGTFSEEGFERESILLNEIPVKKGVYPIKGSLRDIYDGFVGGSYITLTDDGDAIDDVYLIDESAVGNQLVIESVDTLTNIIRGNFTVSFRMDPDEWDTRNMINPIKVKFSNGVFEVRLLD
jgi:hypothetical protein